MFLATGLIPGAAAPEADEILRPVPLTWRAALAKVRSGAICDAKSIIGLQLARERLGRPR